MRILTTLIALIGILAGYVAVSTSKYDVIGQHINKHVHRRVRRFDYNMFGCGGECRPFMECFSDAMCRMMKHDVQYECQKHCCAVLCVLRTRTDESDTGTIVNSGVHVSQTGSETGLSSRYPSPSLNNRINISTSLNTTSSQSSGYVGTNTSVNTSTWHTHGLSMPHNTSKSTSNDTVTRTNETMWHTWFRSLMETYVHESNFGSIFDDVFNDVPNVVDGDENSQTTHQTIGGIDAQNGTDKDSNDKPKNPKRGHENNKGGNNKARARNGGH
ncbi:uncharacterized protein LOC127853313 [Dreissena polymorpha]|uniref:Uncharacterized protein n=1 Tax=Dreissena polymorpha TaxID=45954 RepID=A0A9D4CNX6_DREPO|nr:uncharacterized protein LOC127853313 [Dreissena polymorpha]KAH3728176.1 hypothetical protein DPMN_054124 [Dreissena polymorpha]